MNREEIAAGFPAEFARLAKQDNDLLARLDALYAKAMQGPYFIDTDEARDCPAHKDSGLAMIDTGRESDWPVLRLGEWGTTQFIVALLNEWPEIRKALQPDGWVSVPAEPTQKMVDAPRQIILYAETPGRTREGLRAHLVRSGVDYLAWFPVWATRDTGHLTKSMIAELVYRAMLAAREE